VLAPHFIDRSSRLAKPRTVRAATQRRIIRKSRARYTGVTRVFVTMLCVLLLLMSYVVLTSSLTGLSYAVAKAGADREALQEETMRLDDRIAAMRSDDRLSQLAARLGMHEPQHLAVVRLVPTHIARVHPRLPMLSSLAGFFMPAMARKP
jgi:cell division protein FtsL